MQKRSHEPIYKTHTKIEAKKLRATTFAIAKLEERYWKNYHFNGSNNIFADCMLGVCQEIIMHFVRQQQVQILVLVIKQDFFNGQLGSGVVRRAFVT